MSARQAWFDIEPRGKTSLHGSLLRAALGGGLPCALLALAFAGALLELPLSKLFAATLGSGLFGLACLLYCDASRSGRPWLRLPLLGLFALIWTALDIWFAGLEVGFRVHAFSYFELHEPPVQTLLLGIFLAGPAEARRWRLQLAEQMAAAACAYAGLCWFLQEELLFEHFRWYMTAEQALALGALLPVAFLLGGRLQRRVFGARGAQAGDADEERRAAGLPLPKAGGPRPAARTLIRARMLVWAPLLLALLTGLLENPDAALRAYYGPAAVVALVFCVIPLE